MLTSDQVPFAPTAAFLMSALPSHDGTLVGWVYTYNGAAGKGVIGRATAPTPEGPWSVDAEPVLEPGPDGALDDQMVLEPDAVRTDEGYAMYYTGVDGDGIHRIGRATSPDGIAWTRSAEPILAGSQDWDRGTIGEPEVEATDDGWVMVYRTAARSAFGLGVATSPDGLTWTPAAANPILDPQLAPAPSFSQASLVAWQDGLLYLLEGGSLGGTGIYAMELVPAGD